MENNSKLYKISRTKEWVDYVQGQPVYVYYEVYFKKSITNMEMYPYFLASWFEEKSGEIIDENQCGSFRLIRRCNEDDKIGDE